MLALALSGCAFNVIEPGVHDVDIETALFDLGGLHATFAPQVSPAVTLTHVNPGGHNGGRNGD